ncbi:MULTISPECIES: hypothetical protein [Streptomyces]|uniref:hypothetical protein n=1 Tax=Streptomyces TaxID=1883 RepID=UPI000D4DCBE2|nr:MULTISPECIES: hypothetical protein [Streptomyces]PTM93667.1 hypothetical protein C7821_10737 [Streptomyces sp. VMFN-G11Ma]
MITAAVTSLTKGGLQSATKSLAIVLGYLDVEFSFTDRPALNVKLSVLATRVGDDWRISHYQVSRLGQTGLASGPGRKAKEGPP